MKFNPIDTIAIKGKAVPIFLSKNVPVGVYKYIEPGAVVIDHPLFPIYNEEERRYIKSLGFHLFFFAAPPEEQAKMFKDTMNAKLLENT